MSLILDALRKSDVEHARQKAPGVATPTAQVAPAQRSRLWPIVVIALLLNAAFLAWLLWGRDGDDATAQQQPPAPRTTLADIATAPREPVIPSTKANVRSLLDETIRETAEQRNALQPAPPLNTASTAPATTKPTPVLTEPDDPNLTLPTLGELRASGRTSLPDMSIALHVYNAAPSSRFAFMAGRKVTEGTQLENGARVVQITPYGVILEHDGERLLLPRE